ncbi:MAG: MFS transporter, partial [Phycisphaerae bacterium]|nr:MFS transporter [Phycisphaerae bacterium]
HVVSPLIILAACNGAIAAFNMPAWQVLTPRLVPRDELTRAITVNGVQFNLTRVIGPALAGVAMSSWGTTPLFMVNAVSFLGVVLTAMTTPDAPAPAHDGMRAWRQVHAALRFIFLSKGPLAVFVAMTLMSLLAAPLVRVLSLFVIDVFQPGKEMEEAAGGYLLAVQGLGAVLGGLALKYIPDWYPKHHFIPLSVMACGLSVTAFALTTTLWAGYLAMFVCGFFWIWAFNQSWAAMQHLVSDAMRGRVLALANVFSFGATALGSVALGLIGESLKHKWGWSAGAATQASVAALSIPLMLAGLVMLLRRTPEVDGPMRGQPGKGGIDVVEAITARSHRPSAPLAPGAGGRVENPSQAKLGA